jgi:hypothetical protein
MKLKRKPFMPSGDPDFKYVVEYEGSPHIAACYYCGKRGSGGGLSKSLWTHCEKCGAWLDKRCVKKHESDCIMDRLAK